MFRLIFLLIVTLLAPLASSESSPRAMSFTRMYSDGAGVSHFAEGTIPFGEENAMGARVSPFTSATSIGYLLLPPGFTQDWSPTPIPQWVIVLAGSGEIEMQDGETREFPVGSILLVEDTTGIGHKTRNVGMEPLIIAWIPTRTR